MMSNVLQVQILQEMPKKENQQWWFLQRLRTSPTMVYFGQEFGEPGAEDLGFGDPTRTSIFDYGIVPSMVRWVNDKQFDGGQSTPEE